MPQSVHLSAEGGVGGAIACVNCVGASLKASSNWVPKLLQIGIFSFPRLPGPF